MSAAAPQSALITFDEYLKLVEKSEDKLDFMNGRVANVSELIAMSGGTLPHSLIIANLIREIGFKLKGKPCRVFDSNLRIGAGTGNITHYPDAGILCGEPITDLRDRSGQTHTDPIAPFEVLSPSMMGYDFGEKSITTARAERCYAGGRGSRST